MKLALIFTIKKNMEKIKMKINDYINLVNEIADGYFNDDEYIPVIGRMNTLAIYADRFTEINMGESENATDYISEILKNADVMARFKSDIESREFFSFGCAVADAAEIVDMKKQKIANKNEFTELIHTIDEKVKELSEILNEDDIMRILNYMNGIQEGVQQETVKQNIEIKEEAE